MRNSLGVAAFTIAATLLASACSKEQAVTQSVPASTPAVAAMPDVGHVSAQKVSTQGVGATEEQALLEALKTAVMEVNGTTISVADLSVREDAQAHLQAQDSDGNSGSLDASLQSQDFVHAIAQRSGGVIDHFTITKVESPGLLNKQYTVSIDAYINKFHAAKSAAKKLKIVVAPVRFTQSSYDIGGTKVAADTLSEDITQRITNALVQSGRFDVLSRGSDPTVEQELQLISSGQTDKQNLAKLNQTIPADVVLAGSIDSLAYTRHSRALAISDRPLVSYDGHWAFSDKIINVTTRELMSGSQIGGDFPSVAPTTMPVSVDAQGLLGAAEDKIVSEAVAQVIREIYPITVVSVQGDVVVLSQGGSSLQVGKTYQLMKAGQLIKDPQTGETIGHVKTSVGAVMIDRVDDKLSYGHLVSGSKSLLATDGSVRLGEMLAPVVAMNSSSSPQSEREAATDASPQAPMPKTVTSSRPAIAHAKTQVTEQKIQSSYKAAAALPPAAPPPAKTDPNW